MNIEKWRSTRKKGKKHFVLKHGVFDWGLTTAILFSIVMHFIYPVDPAWIRPVIALLLFPLGGILYGHFEWRACEAKFKKQTESQSYN